MTQADSAVLVPGSFPAAPPPRAVLVADLTMVEQDDDAVLQYVNFGGTGWRVPGLTQQSPIVFQMGARAPPGWLRV